MPATTLDEVLRLLLVDPASAAEGGEEPLHAVFNLDLGSSFGWELRYVDEREAAELAYRRYYYKGMGCGYGAFYAIVSAYAAKYGEPYSSFPLQVLEHKKGRFSGKDKICGSLVGAGAAMSLFAGQEREEMFAELVKWYEDAPLPVYIPAPGMLNENGEPLGMELEVPVSTAGGPHCHSSLSAWAQSCAGVCPGQMHDKERKERCARLTASVTARAVEIMNRKAVPA